MNATVKKKWLEALRSGKYDQIRGILRCGNAFCCLGVLCDIHSKETGKEWRKEKHYSYFYYETNLPLEVCKWAGIPSNNPTVDDYTLAYRNDTLQQSFNEIAEVIETHL